MALAANVVTAAIRQADLGERLQATRELLAAQSRQRDIMRQRLDAGGISRADLSNQELLVAQTQATLAGMRAARDAGALTSIDLNLRPALWPDAAPVRERLWQALERADLVKLAREELDYLRDGDDEAPVLARLLRHARLVVVTDGPAPIRWHARGDLAGTLPTLSVRTLDSTAAGDAFIGGLLVFLQRAGIAAPDFDGFAADPARIGEALRYASACGALAVTRYGSFAALPSHDEVAALLETGRVDAA